MVQKRIKKTFFTKINFLRIWQDNKLQKLIIKKNKTKILKFDWTNYTKEFHQFSKNIN